MHLIVTEDYAQLSAAAAHWVVAQITARPDATAVFPTGNSPVGLYEELTSRRQRGELDASRLRIFLLDEYVGLTPEDPRTLYGWLANALLTPLGITAGQIYRLPNETSDVADCQAYDEALRVAGGLDFAVLGLGPNGHLGYNEPPAAGDAPTRVLTLTDSSLDSAASYFGSRARVPRQAITLGMKQLLAARQVLLIVAGAAKRDILWQALKGPVTPAVPASYLQEAANVTVVADRAAWPG